MNLGTLSHWAMCPGPLKGVGPALSMAQIDKAISMVFCAWSNRVLACPLDAVGRVEIDTLSGSAGRLLSCDVA